MTEEISPHLRYWEESCEISTFAAWCSRHEPWKKELCAMIVELNFKSVLDIGCGTGVMKDILDMYKFSKEHAYLGTEITPKFLDLCRLKEIPVVDLDLRDLTSLTDEAFECTLCLDVLNHQKEDPRALLNGIMRVTKKLAIVSFFRDFLAGRDHITFTQKHDNLIYAAYSRKYIEEFLETLDVTYEWVERKTTESRFSKPPTLFIMKD